MRRARTPGILLLPRHQTSDGRAARSGLPALSLGSKKTLQLAISEGGSNFLQYINIIKYSYSYSSKLVVNSIKVISAEIALLSQ